MTPAPYDPNCPECQGSGLRDSGGFYPWGESISLPCDCDRPLPADPVEFAQRILEEDTVIMEHLK